MYCSGLSSVDWGINPQQPIYFDSNGDGIRTATGWVKPDDGLLVLDLNGNGTIDSGRELFGDATLIQAHSSAAGSGQVDYTRTALDGFEALAAQDSNADGQINASDAAFSQLKVWRDLNQDGISQAGELHTLAELGIASIGVAGTSTNVNLGNGNTEVLAGSYTGRSTCKRKKYKQKQALALVCKGFLAVNLICQRPAQAVRGRSGLPQ
jgi:hypothetical protein